MLKNKKSMVIVLSCVMVFALTCSAWAADGIRAIGVSVPSSDIVADVVTTVDADHGAYANNQGSIAIDGYDISTSGRQAYGAYANDRSSLTMHNEITTSGYNSTGLFANLNSDATMVGKIITSGYNGVGAASINSTLSMKGNIETTGDEAEGVYSSGASSVLTMTGDIKTTGYHAFGAYAITNATLIVTGNITTTGDASNGATSNSNSVITVTGDITATGDNLSGVSAATSGTLEISGDILVPGNKAIGANANSADVTVNGNVTVDGEESYGLQGINNGTVNMNDGTITIADDSSSGAKLENDGIANLTNVAVDAGTLLASTTSGTLNAESSDLNGDVVQMGTGSSAILGINLEDSTMTGAVLAAGDLGNQKGGVVDITLENSDWIVTGDSNTNGTITGDGNSTVDFSQAPDGTVVTVDEIVGEIDFDLKVGDQLNVTNTDGNNTFGSSDPDVLGVEQNEDGSWSIVSKGEGDADLTYTYKDPNTGTTQTVTTGVTSVPDSTGNTGGNPQSYSGGSSSNCNAGLGLGALFSLLGMAVIQKRK